MNAVYSKLALPVGTMVQEYRIIKILGTGGFGIVYIAENKYFSEVVALKEFLPSDMAYRVEGEDRVIPLSSETEKAYQWARKKFLEEAKTLRELGHPDQHPNIVRVKQFIEANDTAYMVMDLEKGQPFQEILEQRGPLEEDEICGILSSLLDGLERIHGAFVWHRDIKPSNILIRPDGSPVLIDFGAARKDIFGRDQSMMAIYSLAYAAPEQFHPDGNQGPWTDIYALGATLYKAVTGSPPANAAIRVQDDTYVLATEAAGGNYSPHFLAAIDAALRLYPKDRPQSIFEWRALFRNRAEIDDEKTCVRPSIKNRPPKKKTGYHRLLAVITVFAVGGILAAGWWFYQAFSKPPVIEPAVPVANEKADTEEHDEKAIQTKSDRVEPVADEETIVEEKVILFQTALTIASVPAKAHVYVDGEYQGLTPLDAIVDDGTHTLRLTLKDHYDWESTLLVEENLDIPIRIPLLKR